MNTLILGMVLHVLAPVPTIPPLILSCYVHVTHYVSARKTNRLIVYRETVAVYCEDHTKHTNTLCRQNAEF
jgi:hypothetical protein